MHTPHTVCGPIGSSTEGSCGSGCMRQRHPVRHTPHTVRGPTGSSTEGSSGSGCMRSVIRHTPHT
eukprot:6678782-Pyramimonas_sp.AAC.1